MLHVINSRALTGEKPCINKAIHVLLMHGYATFNMIVHRFCCRYEMCTARPKNEYSQWKLRSRDIGEKVKQNSARNNKKCSKCFQFLCNNSNQIWFFNALTFPRSHGRCWKPRPLASVFNTSHRTWRMLMHEKPCLIPILVTAWGGAVTVSDLKFQALHSLPVLPKFCFLCSCFLKYLVEWQTVWTQIRLLH